MSQKLAFKWLGFDRIYNAVEGKEIYILEKLDKLHLAGTFAENCLKRFQSRQQFCLNYTPDSDQKVLLTLEDFLTVNDNNLSKILDGFSN